MMAKVKEKLIAKEAIDAAFGYFKEFFADQQLKNVLLEGLEFLDDSWEVSIGFDIGRQKKKGGQLSFLDGTIEPIREVRTISVSATDGAFQRMY